MMKVMIRLLDFKKIKTINRVIIYIKYVYLGEFGPEITVASSYLGNKFCKRTLEIWHAYPYGLN